MTQSPEQRRPNPESQTPQPHIEYQQLIDRLEGLTARNIELTSYQDEFDPEDIKAAINNIPGMKLLRILQTAHAKAVSRTREGGVYRPLPKTLEDEKSLIEIMSAQADAQAARNEFISSGADNALRGKLSSAETLDVDGIWAGQTILDTPSTAIFEAFGLPADTTRTQFNRFKEDVKAALRNRLSLLKTDDTPDHGITQPQIPEINQLSDITPEVHEQIIKQSRIDKAMFAIATDYFQPKGTIEQDTTTARQVDAARQAVEEATSPPGPETITNPTAETIEAIISLTPDHTLVNTDMPSKVRLNPIEGAQNQPEPVSSYGFQTFGAIADREGEVRKADRRRQLVHPRNKYGDYAPHPESIIFTPIVDEITKETTTYERAPGVLGVFGKTNPVTRTETVGTQPRQIVNRLTGETENAVAVDYTFKPSLDLGSDVTYRAADGRPGNHIYWTIILPESVARQLQAAVLTSPNIARELSHRLIVDNCGIPEGYWEGTVPNDHTQIKPPYESLPSDWKLAVRTPESDWQNLKI